MRIHLLTSILFLLILLSCKEQTQNSIQTIDPTTFSKKTKTTQNPQILDVRTPEEFKEEHIKNALNMDWLGEHFVQDAEKLDKNKAVYVYCKSGRRSLRASEKLEELGFKNIYNLDGGYLKWCAESGKSN